MRLHRGRRSLLDPQQLIFSHAGVLQVANRDDFEEFGRRHCLYPLHAGCEERHEGRVRACKVFEATQSLIGHAANGPLYAIGENMERILAACRNIFPSSKMICPLERLARARSLVAARLDCKMGH